MRKEKAAPVTWSILINSLKSWFLVHPGRPDPAPFVAPVRQNTVKLTGMLIVTGQRQDQSKFKFMATEIGESNLIFKSTLLLGVGEKMDVELFVPGSEMLKTAAVVDWVLKSRSGCTGQLSLSTTTEQGQTLREFAQRQRHRRR